MRMHHSNHPHRRRQHQATTTTATTTELHNSTSCCSNRQLWRKPSQPLHHPARPWQNYRSYLEQPYVLYRARRVHDDRNERVQHPDKPLPTYLAPDRFVIARGRGGVVLMTVVEYVVIV